MPSFSMGAGSLNSWSSCLHTMCSYLLPRPCRVAFLDAAGEEKKAIKRMVTMPMTLFSTLLRTDFNPRGQKQPGELRQGRATECRKSPGSAAPGDGLSGAPNRCLNQPLWDWGWGGGNARVCILRKKRQRDSAEQPWIRR